MATIGSDSAAGAKHEHRLVIEGYPVEGVSIGGKETCVVFPTLGLAFDIGMCPRRAVSQAEFLFVSHGHLDHIGALHKYVAARGFLSLRPPTVFVPACLGDRVERLFELYHDISQSELKNSLVTLEVGEEYEFRRDLKVRAFRTCHVIPSQVSRIAWVHFITYPYNVHMELVMKKSSDD
jgi:ribonuclease Z